MSTTTAGSGRRPPWSRRPQHSSATQSVYWLPSSEKIVVGGGNDGLEALGRAVNDAQLENRQAYTSVRMQNFTSCVRLLFMTQRQRNVTSLGDLITLLTTDGERVDAGRGGVDWRLILK